MTRDGPQSEVRVAAQAFPAIVDISLPESPSTGYLWDLESAPASVREHGSTFVQPRGRVAGGGGTRVFQIEVAAPGRHQLEFRLRRPWEGDALERRVVDLLVEE